MSRYAALWSTTSGLFAVAVSILIFAAVHVQTSRYQFASTPRDNEMVWRGDTMMGDAVLCGTDRLVNEFDRNNANQTVVRKC